jgi:GDP-L-fucose synthase
VEDAAEGIVLGAEKYDGPDPVNLGSGAEISIRDLVVQVKELVGFRGSIEWDASQPDGQPRRCLDTSRAEREFGWHSGTPLREGLQNTIAWFAENCLEPAKAVSA